MVDDRDPLTELRRVCLALPEVTERPSHSSPTWFIRDKKTFVSFVGEHHGKRLAFWCAAPPGTAAELIGEDPGRFFRPPYVGHRGWLGVYVDTPVDWAEMTEIILDAYRAVAPRRLLAELPERLPDPPTAWAPPDAT
ncbi:MULTISPECIES: MmcQ/YjbR family DNA-binding protein [Pseudofrankia]|uniref:MmcQ/YjbR family DNA-binding protein n=1 Tax=Pseudofrankia TaxID=2994363 RepID=UPI000234CAB7|nr:MULTISPECIES: MmcQ/YjbR family DNA-binding protein [Pseudofrankia]OHV39950.1 phosphoribosylglycinamide formyltransferase [Pseudofrankia sp. EUN1h]